MSVRSILLLALAALLLIPASASAKTEKSEKLGLEITFPEGWETRAADWMLQGKTGMVGVMLAKATEPTIKETVDALKKNIGQLIPNGKVGKQSDTKLAGLKSVRLELSGGPPKMAFEGYVVITQLKKDVTAMYLVAGPAADYKKQKAALDGVYKSVKKLAPAKKDKAAPKKK